MSEDLTLHPRVRQAIYEGNRDKPLTLNWAPIEPDAYAHLGLPALNPPATKARTQIIAEALAAGQRFVSYSRFKQFYTHGQRYYRPTYSYRAILPAVDQLAAAGVIEHEKVPPGHRGFQSRFRASTALLAETASTGVIYKPLEIIMVRDVEGNPIDYRDNRDTRRMRKWLRALNEGLSSLEIGIDGQIVREGDRLENGGRARVQLQRIFHRSDFELGGRFYGAHWQNMENRHRLSINGEDTVEHDYAGMHIQLLYAEAGKPSPADPYDVDGWPRQQAKLALLIAINARTHIDAVRALADALRKGGGVSDPFATAEKLVRAVKARHPDIAHAIGSDAGVRLMRRDSDLAEQIMWEMLRTTGIVPLSVHDSFIVPRSQEEKLKEAMENAFPCRTTVAKSLVEPHPNFATSQVFEISTEPPETPLQDGRESGPGTRGRGGGPGTGVGGSAEHDERGRRDGLMSLVAGVIKKQLDEHEARMQPTKMVLEMVAKLSPEVRMLALCADNRRIST
jgi:hypothetical protein